MSGRRAHYRLPPWSLPASAATVPGARPRPPRCHADARLYPSSTRGWLHAAPPVQTQPPPAAAPHRARGAALSRPLPVLKFLRAARAPCSCAQPSLPPSVPSPSKPQPP